MNIQQDLQPNRVKERSLFDGLIIEPDPKPKRSQVKDRFLQRGISQLPLESKIGLFSKLSFGGLMTISIAGGLILYSSLTNRLLQQTESKLIAKSQIVELLLSEEKIDSLSILDRTVAAITEEDYTAVYLPQDGGLALSASSQNIDPERSDLFLTNEEILNSATAVEGIVSQIQTIEGHQYALAAKTISDSGGRVGVVIHGSSFNSVYGILKSSLLTQAVLSILLWLLIFYLGKILAKAIALPLDNLLQVVENFTWGNWQARSIVNTADKIGALSNTLNVLADSLEFNEVRLTQEAERSRILKETAFDISLTADVSEILHITVENARKILLCDRVIYQDFKSSERRVIAESVDERFTSAWGLKIDGFLEADRTIAIANIYQSELPKDYLEVLESLAVVAVLVIPVVIKDNPIGWLIAHQCSEARTWQDEEINLLSQMAFGLGRAIEKIELLELQQQAQERERVAKENLQRRALELLMEVDPVSQGDLTVQVKVKEDEIGTIADSYNATIESLRKLVAQVKTAAIEVSSTTNEKDRSIQELSTGASAQTLEINTALARIQGITDSISAVAKNAKAAEAAMLRAVQTVKAGDEAMTLTVEGFQEIRDTVAATAKKVKRLGESSQKISKVVNVIGNFAEQTNLLALNASIEAAHAGEQGRGFGVVASEVRSLARQSASATAEIEALVAEIQTGTKEVVAAMEEGTQQVVAGTKLVDKTRFSLIEIADVSQEIDRLVAEIAVATVEQSHDSEVVSQTMKQVAAISDRTATEAGEVSASFKDLLAVAQQLKDSVSKFKVN